VVVGGEILATRPRPGETEIELLARRLDGDDRPEITDDSEGRALITTARFLDPAVYAEGRRITIVGTVTGGEERKIGELPYLYPVIGAEGIRLWPRAHALAPGPGPGYPWPLYYGPYLGPYRYWRGPPAPWWPYWW
jgi:outer membrane lipoprotein